MYFTMLIFGLYMEGTLAPSYNPCVDLELSKTQCVRFLENIKRVFKEVETQTRTPKKDSRPLAIVALLPDSLQKSLQESCPDQPIELSFDISRLGTTTAIQLKSHTDSDLGKEAAKALHKWKFIPAITNNTTVDSKGHRAFYRCVDNKVQLLWNG